MTQDKHPDSPAAVASMLRQLKAIKISRDASMPSTISTTRVLTRAAELIEAQQIPANPTERQLKAFARHIARLQGQLAKARRDAKPGKTPPARPGETLQAYNVRIWQWDINPRPNGD